MLDVVLALLVILVVARVAGLLFRRLRQPAVIGEILAGILLGPSLLGRVAPDLSAHLFPAAVTSPLGAVAQVGVVLYMFVIGLQLDLGAVRSRARAAVAISQASIVLPLALGAALAVWLHPLLAPAGVPRSAFALFLGVSMSVTAFPVLARILRERGLDQRPLGTLVLAVAAVDDVSAWCLLAVLVGMVDATTGAALLTLGLTVGFVAAMLLGGRPAARRMVRWHARRGALTPGMMSVVAVALLACSLTTEAIGIHALFGGFLLGALVPHGSALARELVQWLEAPVVVLFLPVFFAVTGLRTEIALLDGPQQWGICAVIVLVACTGKFGGSALAARWSGIGWRDAAAIGVLLNTRGLMELIVLNVGLDLGVISPALFAMLVLMTVVTTFATTPALQWLGVGQSGSAASIR